MANIRPQLPAVPKSADTQTRVFLTAVANILRELSRSSGQPASINQGNGLTGGSQISGLNKASIGLGSVDNTADKDKPISTSVRDALERKLDQDEFGFYQQNLNHVGDWDVAGQSLQIIGAASGSTYKITGQGSYAGKALKEGDFVKFYVNANNDLDVIVFINGNLKADKATTINAGNGLTGGGDLSANRTLTLGMPSDISSTSTNALTTNSHTHALDDTGIPAGTYTKVVFDVKGRALNGGNLAASDIPSLSWAKITTGKPTTLNGYGITDAVNTNALGAANGVATLGGDGRVPLNQLPAMGSSGTAVPMILFTTFTIPDYSQVLFTDEIEFDENGMIDIGFNSVLCEVS